MSDSETSTKNWYTTFLLCVLFVGIFGAHQFYLGRWKMGVLYLVFPPIGFWLCLRDIYYLWTGKMKDAEGKKMHSYKNWHKKVYMKNFGDEAVERLNKRAEEFKEKSKLQQEQAVKEMKAGKKELEERRIANEKKAEERRIADEKRAEEKRYERRIADEKRAEEKRYERRISNEKRAETKRVSAKKKAQKKAEKKITKARKAEAKRLKSRSMDEITKNMEKYNAPLAKSIKEIDKKLKTGFYNKNGTWVKWDR